MENEAGRPLAFWPEDPTLHAIFRLDRTCASLEEALISGLRLACSLPDWRAGRFRLLWPTEAASEWSGIVDGGILAPDVLTAPPAIGIAPEPLTIDILNAADASSPYRDARVAGLRTAARLVVHAEDRAVAEVELFGAGRVDSRNLRLLVARLDLVAARERNRIAVRAAAAHVRAGRRGGADSTNAPEASPLLDPATGLPRERLLDDRLLVAMLRRRRGDDGSLAVVRIEPTAGFAERDGPWDVAAVGRRLRAVVRESDTVAHVADGFAVVAEDLSTLAEAEALATRLAEAARPGTAGSGPRPTPRVGLVVAEPHHETPADLLADAERAMREAPAGGGLHVLRRSGGPVADRELLESELRRALGSRELFLEYQPLVSLDDGRIAGLEAFVRWQHPKVGRIPPGEFLWIASTTPLIHDLGDWVVDQVCEQVQRWRTHLPASRRVPSVDVNFSQVQLLNPGFVDRLLVTLRRHELPGEAIRVDVSEGDIMDAADEVRGALERLNRHGIRAVVDDFGTGFSCLPVLHALPVVALKIDGSMLPPDASDGAAWTLARSIIELGRVLGLEVVAENVETLAQLKALRHLGCRLGQGYVFAGPVGAGRAAELMRDGYPLELHHEGRLRIR